jgi:hypothetical protein
MNRDDLIDALNEFTERTGFEWQTYAEHSLCDGEMKVLFTWIEEDEDE